MTLTYNPNLAEAKVNLHTKYQGPTVSLLMICNSFVQTSLKLLNLLFYNVAGAIAIVILRFGYNQFFLFSSGWYSSGTCPWYPMQNIQASNLMIMLHFVMIVLNMYANWSGKAKTLRRSMESQVKVTRKVIRCIKLNVTVLILRSMVKTPCGYDTWCPENLCISLVNRL